METYVAVTGPVPSIELWETDMMALKFPFDSTGDEKKDCYIRCGVCPVRLYKILHPEDQQENMMNHIGLGKEESHVTKNHPKIKRYVGWIRKALGIKECPTPTNPVPHMQPDQVTKAVAIVPIGFKKDTFGENGVEQI